MLPALPRTFVRILGQARISRSGCLFTFEMLYNRQVVMYLYELSDPHLRSTLYRQLFALAHLLTRYHPNTNLAFLLGEIIDIHEHCGFVDTSPRLSTLRGPLPPTDHRP